jgi:hypothetical protein
MQRAGRAERTDRPRYLTALNRRIVRRPLG